MACWRGMHSYGVRVAVLVAVVAVLVSCDLPGFCPFVPGQSAVALDKVMGTWWEYERFYNDVEGNLDCCQANANIWPAYKQHFLIVNTGYNQTSRQWVPMNGVGEQDPVEPAQFWIKYQTYIPNLAFLVVATDYEKFLLAWQCMNLLETHVEAAWILTRKRGDLDPATRNRTYEMLQRHQVDTSQFMMVSQHDCPSVP